MTPYRIHQNSNPGTAHPPLPRPEPMHVWLERRKPSLLRRIVGAWR